MFYFFCDGARAYRRKRPRAKFAANGRGKLLKLGILGKLQILVG
jgi:hypothetical protein